MSIVLIDCLEIFTRAVSSGVTGSTASTVPLFTWWVVFCDIVFNCCPALTAFGIVIGSCGLLSTRFVVVKSKLAIEVDDIFPMFSVTCTELRYSATKYKNVTSSDHRQVAMN